MVILEEQQQQNWAFEREVKAEKAALVRKGAVLTVEKTFAVKLDDEDDIISGPRAVEGRSSLQAAADLEPGFEGAGTASKRAVDDQEGQRNKSIPDIRYLGLVAKSGLSDKALDFMQRMQKENAALNISCAAEEDACAKSPLEMSTLWFEKAAQKKRIEELKRRLAEQLSAQKRRVEEKRHTADAVSVKKTKEKLYEQVKELSVRMNE